MDNIYPKDQVDSDNQHVDKWSSTVMIQGIQVKHNKIYYLA